MRNVSGNLCDEPVDHRGCGLVAGHEGEHDTMQCKEVHEDFGRCVRDRHHKTSHLNINGMWDSRVPCPTCGRN